MSIIKHLVPGFISDRYLDLKRRLARLELAVKNLETAMDGFIVNPKYVPADEVGFNGQLFRKRIFGEIMAAIPVDAIVETGTWLGNTSAYMAETARRPVYTCEMNPRFHALAKLRVAALEQVHLEQGDSRGFLQKVVRGALGERNLFFYLDAHWYEDLPLAEEVDIIAAHRGGAVVMIDDFKVPDDPGYGYDDYGNGKVLELELLASAMARHNLTAYFPAAAAREETGAKRGCVVLAPKGELAEKLSRVKSLRMWNGS